MKANNKHMSQIDESFLSTLYPRQIKKMIALTLVTIRILCPTIINSLLSASMQKKTVFYKNKTNRKNRDRNDRRTSHIQHFVSCFFLQRQIKAHLPIQIYKHTNKHTHRKRNEHWSRSICIYKHLLRQPHFRSHNYTHVRLLPYTFGLT